MRALVIAVVVLLSASSAAALPTPAPRCIASASGVYSIAALRNAGSRARRHRVEVFAGATCSGPVVASVHVRAVDVGVTDAGVVVAICSRSASPDRVTIPVVEVRSSRSHAYVELRELRATARLRPPLSVSVEATGVRFESAGGGSATTIAFDELEATIH